MATLPAQSQTMGLNMSNGGDARSTAGAPPCAHLMNGLATRIEPSVATVRSRQRRLRLALLVLAILAVFAVLLVGGEVLQRYFVPELSTALSHASLTLRAGISTAFACLVVFLVMRKQQRQLSEAADQLARLLESYQKDGATTGRFQNPHLVHCRDIMECGCQDCTVHCRPDLRCWQQHALALTEGDGPPRLDIRECHQCEVYQASCPDKLTELGESFNNLMFLLQEESERLDQMQAHMVEKEKMVAVGQLAAGIAHEVGNPLSSISSIIQMLKRKRDLDLPAEQLDLIETHVSRISKTLRQMVTLARPKTERWELLDVGRLLREVIGLVSFDRRARDVEFTCDIEKSLPAARGVGDQLQQVFLNLAINALDAMPDGGRLAFSARKNCSNILIQVRDSGCGIDPALRRRIFDPFFTTKEPGNGSGLGLSVSYGIMQKHGGSIEVETAPGEGTAFTVKLPMTPHEPTE